MQRNKNGEDLAGVSNDRYDEKLIFFQSTSKKYYCCAKKPRGDPIGFRAFKHEVLFGLVVEVWWITARGDKHAREQQKTNDCAAQYAPRPC